MEIGVEFKMGELLAMEMYLGAKRGGGSNHHEMHSHDGSTPKPTRTRVHQRQASLKNLNME